MALTVRYAQRIPTAINGEDGAEGAAGENGAEGEAGQDLTAPEPVYVVTSGATVTLDLDVSNKFRIVANADFNLDFTGGVDGFKFSVSITQGSSAPNIPTYVPTIRWANGGTVPSIADATGKRTTLGFEKWIDGATVEYDGFLIGSDI